MSRISIGTSRGAITTGAGERAETSDRHHPEGPAPFLQRVARGLEQCARHGTRAALLVVELEPQYVRRSEARVPAVLGEWSRRRRQSVQFARIGERRYAVFFGPVALPGQARQLAEELAHKLDPRVCPLLRRALPYACWGVAATVPEMTDAAALLARADQDLEQRRRGGGRCRTLLRARRRHAAAAVLQPLPIALR